MGVKTAVPSSVMGHSDPVDAPDSPAVPESFAPSTDRTRGCSAESTCSAKATVGRTVERLWSRPTPSTGTAGLFVRTYPDHEITLS